MFRWIVRNKSCKQSKVWPPARYSKAARKSNNIYGAANSSPKARLFRRSAHTLTNKPSRTMSNYKARLSQTGNSNSSNTPSACCGVVYWLVRSTFIRLLSSNIIERSINSWFVISALTNFSSTSNETYSSYFSVTGDAESSKKLFDSISFVILIPSTPLILIRRRVITYDDKFQKQSGWKW